MPGATSNAFTTVDADGQVAKKRNHEAVSPDLHLPNTSLIECLEQDPRPSYLLLVGPDHDCSAESRLVFCNSALLVSPVHTLIESLYHEVKEPPDFQSQFFRDWTLDFEDGASPFPSNKTFQGFTWTAISIRSSWRIISGFETGQSSSEQNGFLPITTPAPSPMRKLDWTAPDSVFEMTQHIQWIRDFDWSNTSLGAMETWTYPLRAAVNMAMADPSPVALYWGFDKAIIYNEAFIPVFHMKHPWALGRPFEEVYADLAVEMKDFYDELWATLREKGKSKIAERKRFVLPLRDEWREEVFFSYTLLPVLEEAGYVEGFRCSFDNVTSSVHAARRASMLKGVTDANYEGVDPQLFWRKIIEPLSANDGDITSVFVYSVRPPKSIPTDDHTENVVLEAFSPVTMDGRGVPCGHSLLMRDSAFQVAFGTAVRTGSTHCLDIKDSAIARSLVTNDSHELPTSLVICSTDPKLQSQGILIIGIAPLCRYDVEYQRFIENLTRGLSASLAASDRAQFAHEAIVESELRFSQMTATSPAAHFEVSLDGQILYVNDRWHAMTGMPLPGHEIPAMSWLSMVYEPDIPIIESEWVHILSGKSITFEIRLKKDWQATNPFSGEILELDYTWVLCMASQHDTKTGKTIMGCLIDLNRQKWAEEFHKRKTEEAIEMKHQQERFIDMTSHEMRNPLSAIFQCSDSIVSTLQEAGDVSAESIKNCVEAAQTISLCAQHQKRIVDDVLLLSKMDASMLDLTPVDTDVKQLLEKGLGIFTLELSANETSMEFVVEKSYQDLRIGRVRLDPSRLLQVLINLTTNALKFTMTEKKERKIVVSLGASETSPSELSSDQAPFIFLPPTGDIVDPTDRPEYGSGDPVYLVVSVKDTGRGISGPEMKELFVRFKQASPRTHVQYGGSGLGLHIARQLTEMQGGQIGVTSERGKGSNFSFYIKARNSNLADIPRLLVQPGNVTVPGAFDIAGPGDLTLSGPMPELQQKKSSKLHILIVEDNIVNQKVLSKQLQNLGCFIYVANHGKEALQVLERTVFQSQVATERKNPLDIVLMDIEMPIMDGLTATKTIRDLQNEGVIKGHVPIIAVSANARSEQIANAMDAGMDDIVSKPFRIPELVSKIHQLLARLQTIH